MVGTRRFAAVTVLALVLIPALGGGSAARATTVPGKTIQVFFIFTENKLVVGTYREGPNGANDLYLGTPPQRGDYAVFNILNHEHKTFKLTFMKKTFTVKPGQKTHFSRALLTRGGFPYSTPSHPSKAFHGVFRVY